MNFFECVHFFLPLHIWCNLLALIMLLQLVICSLTLRFSLYIYFHQPLFVAWFYHLSFASGTYEIIIYSLFECSPVIYNKFFWMCFWNEVASSRNAHCCGIFPPLFQTYLGLKLYHNCCYGFRLFLLNFYKEHVSIQMECSMIFQLLHSYDILRSCCAGYIVLFFLKLYSWRLAHSWDFLWVLWFHILGCVCCYAFCHLCYYGGSFFWGIQFYFDGLLNNGLVLLIRMDLLLIILTSKIIFILIFIPIPIHSCELDITISNDSAITISKYSYLLLVYSW